MKKYTSTLFVVCLIAAMAVTVVAQDSTHGSAAQAQGMQMMCSHSAIVVDDTNAYVVSGNEIMKLDKSSFQVQARAPLPAMASTPAGAGAGPSQMCPMGSITVDNTFVYLARGNEVMRFRKDNLQLDSRCGLPGSATVSATAPAGTGSGPAVTTQPSVPAQTGQGPSMQQDTQMMSQLQTMEGGQFDRAYISGMLQSQTYAARLARVGTQKASNQNVQALASTMLRSHQKQQALFQNNMEASYGVAILPDVNDQQQATLNSLNGLSGADFDRAWLQAMTAEHQQISQMSQLASTKASSGYLRRQSAKMATDSNNEITLMQQMLQNL